MAGVLLAQSGRFDEAAARFERALTLDPSNEAIQRNLDRLRTRQPPARNRPGSSSSTRL